MKKMKKTIERFYEKTLMGFKGTKSDKIIISVCEYILYPEFRKKQIQFKRIFKWSAILATIYFFGAISLNNYVMSTVVDDKDKELQRSYEEISTLYGNAKGIVFDECLDSLKNSQDYIRFVIYAKSGILVPATVPDEHLLAIKHNAEKMKIPLSIYVRVIHHESRFDSSAVNKTSGAMGYMQMMPRTFNHIYEVLSLKGGNTALNNLACGSKLLKQSYDYWYKKKNDQDEAWQMALACYAMGDSLPRALGRVPSSVKDYVNYVMKHETVKNL